MEQTITRFQVLGLSGIFSEKELLEIDRYRHDVLAILSYFATSLFDKDNVDDVLWDIARNCIGQLGMEDCVIYLLDTDKELLIQKAAFGNKDEGSQKILSPIAIPLGNGIVGTVAKTGTSELVSDVTRDSRYILDDMQRGSELTVPLFMDGKVIGVIDSEHSQKGFYGEGHLFLFELIARLTEKKLVHLIRKSKASFTDDNAYYDLCCNLLQKEGLFRSQNISQADVAERISISPGYLSRIVNQVGKCSFTDLVNQHRIEEAKRTLKHPDYTHYSIEGIGYDAGFNSKSAFYSAFKKHTGVSPTQFRKQ